jgi:N utilization substance protein B
MPARRRSRQRALQILFLWDARRQPLDEAIHSYFDTLYADEHPERDDFAVSLLEGTIAHIEEVDGLIGRHAEHWRMERMPAVDRNILRLGVYELLHGATPAAVTIDEALELTRKFSGEESVQFVNGVLDAIHRSHLAGVPNAKAESESA